MTTRRVPRNFYPKVRKNEQRIELDRKTWADTAFLVVAYDTVGTGTFETDLIDFGLVYEDAPFFSYGVELAPDQVLVDDDYPNVSCGVSNWETQTFSTFDGSSTYYVGAYVWLYVDCLTPYNLRFRLAFEGTTMRNVEYFRSNNG